MASYEEEAETRAVPAPIWEQIKRVSEQVLMAASELAAARQVLSQSQHRLREAETIFAKESQQLEGLLNEHREGPRGLAGPLTPIGEARLGEVRRS